MPDDLTHPQGEPEQEPDNGEISDAAAEGIYEICSALADLIRNPKVAEAVAAWLDSRTKRASNPIPYYVSLFFGLLIFAGIGLLAWHKVLTTESTTVLIGALIAAWWGSQRSPQK